MLFRGEHFFIIRDGYPVSPGHLLIISNQLKKDYFELSDEEKEAQAEFAAKFKSNAARAAAEKAAAEAAAADAGKVQTV